MNTALATRASTAPAAIVCVNCGADMAKEQATATMHSGGIICYACAGRMEREAFDKDPARWAGYITAGEHGSDWDRGRRPPHVLGTMHRFFQDATVTSWTGEFLGNVTLAKPTRRRVSEWVGECIYSVKVRNPRTGAEYRGLTYGPGMYVSLTRTGAKK